MLWWKRRWKLCLSFFLMFSGIGGRSVPQSQARTLVQHSCSPSLGLCRWSADGRSTALS